MALASVHARTQCHTQKSHLDPKPWLPCVLCTHADQHDEEGGAHHMGLRSFAHIAVCRQFVRPWNPAFFGGKRLFWISRSASAASDT